MNRGIPQTDDESEKLNPSKKKLDLKVVYSSGNPIVSSAVKMLAVVVMSVSQNLTKMLFILSQHYHFVSEFWMYVLNEKC